MLNDAEKSQLISLIIKQGFRSTNPEILALCDKFTDTSEPTINTVDAESCDGCLYRNTKGECKPCIADERDDGRDVIYVKGGV